MSLKKNKDFKKSQIKPLYERNAEAKARAEKLKPINDKIKYDLKW